MNYTDYAVSERHAMNWFVAEQREGTNGPPSVWSDVDEQMRVAIVNRVRAVYFGRFRTMRQEPPAELMEACCSHVNHIIRHSFYDCLELKPDSKLRNRLFGYEHVGRHDLTNLQIGGQIPGDQLFWVDSWHLSMPERQVDQRIIDRAFAYATSTLMIGDSPRASSHLIELYREPRAIRALIPIRQSYEVIIELFGPFVELVDLLRQKNISLPLWIHLEGWLARSVQ